MLWSKKSQLAQKNWFLSRDKNTTLPIDGYKRKRKTVYAKSWTNVFYGLRTKMLLSGFSRSYSAKDLKKGSKGSNPQSSFQRYTEADNEWLTRDATDEEIRQVVNQISPHKAPGSDSMHAVFYNKCYHIVGKNICLMIRAFFNMVICSGKLIEYTLD